MPDDNVCRIVYGTTSDETFDGRECGGTYHERGVLVQSFEQIEAAEEGARRSMVLEACDRCGNVRVKLDA